MMTVVDTSVWIDFFRQRDSSTNTVVADLIENSEAIALSFVFAELLQGAKNEWEEKLILEFWESLPKIEESHLFIEAGKLSREMKLIARGVGLIDSYILAACKMNNLALWTLDKKLQKEYSRL